MDAPSVKLSFTRSMLPLAAVAVLAMAACSPQAAAPTVAPAKPAPTAAPAKPAPTAAPAQPAPTAAPAKAEASPAKPAATAAPAAKPTEKPAAKPAEFDEKAVADFYKGKTVRIVVGFAPGASTDTNARLLQKVLAKHIPGNPTVAVENKPGGGSMLAANTVYASEPKDGTVIASIDAPVIVQQAIGAPGVQFDAAKFNWLGSTFQSRGSCAVRTDAGISTVQDIMAGGKEAVMGSFGKGSVSYDPPALFNAALGTRFKIVTGYEGGAAVALATKNKEVQGWCISFESFAGSYPDLFEGSNPTMKLLLITGTEVPNHPFLKGVPAAETLARTDEARALLRAAHTPFEIQLPLTAAPEVPKDRVQALRRAFDKAYADPEYVTATEKAGRTPQPHTGEEVSRIAQALLNTPPAMLARIKDALQ